MHRALAAALALVAAATFATAAPAAAAPAAKGEPMKYTAIPAYVKLLEGTTPAVPWPSDAPDDWLLAHIDVETNGLVAGWHEMIDFGLVMTDLDGNVLDSLFVRIQPEHPERTSPGAVAVNAYDPAKWRKLGALGPEEAVEKILAFHKRVAGSKNVLMVALNCSFDTAFLDHLFRRANHSWREMYFYYVLDLPSMLWGLGERDLTSAKLLKRYGIEDEPHVAEYHTGITGAMVNVRIYQALQRLRAEKQGAAGR